MSEFERKVPPCRIVETNHGDTLPVIASRELGDANRWPELVWINSLTHPYITDDPARVVLGVLLSGSMIKVPAPVGLFTDDADRGQVFERDCALVGKQLSVDDGGDISVFTGADNLKQQLEHLICTPRGQALRHPTYGCMLYRLLGTVGGPIAKKLGSDYVRSSLLSDYRVSSVVSSIAQLSGDTLRVTAKAKTIEGSVIDIILTPGISNSPWPGTPTTPNGWGNDYGNNWGN